jgi:putative ABC transport system permease protein
MRPFKALMNLLRRGQVERDLDDELRAHAAMLADEHEARGVPPEAARRAALVEMGGLESVKEQTRETHAGAWIEALAQDVRFGLRMLRRAPSFSLVAIATLALGIGATGAMFSVVDATLFAPLPYIHPERVALLWNHFSPQNAERGALSVADFLDWRDGARAFEDPSAFRRVTVDLTGLTPPEQVFGAEVTGGFFRTLGVAPLLGRALSEGDDRPSSPAVAVIGESLWRRRFDGDPSVIGRPVELDGTPAAIVGVMPAAFRIPDAHFEVWRNLRLTTPAARGPYFLTGVGRLKAGMTWAQAQDDANRVAHGIELAHPAYHQATMPILPLREALVGDARRSIVVLFGSVVVVLLVACVNVANLQLARGAARRREIAMRLALGARRGRILRQLLTESTMLAVFGGLGGTALAWLGIALARQWVAPGLSQLTDLHMKLRIFGFVAVICVATVLMFGVAPALDGTRGDVAAALKRGGRGSAGSAESTRLRRTLVVVELTLSTALLVCGGLLLKSFVRLERVDTGVHAPPERILTMLVSPPATRYPDEQSQAAFFDRALERVRAIPGVTSAAFSDGLAPVSWTNSTSFHFPGQPWTEERFPSSPLPRVSEDYFRTIGVPVLRGRVFDRHDTLTSPRVAVVSETFAKRYFGASDPVGRMVAPGAPQAKQPPYRIVGVVGDLKFSGLESPPEAVWYSAVAQTPDIPMFLVVQSSRSIEGTLPAIERAVRTVDPGTIFTFERTLSDIVGEAVAQPRFRAGLLVGFAAIALLLSAVGTYGVVAYAVAQRTQEIGIRMALGAAPRDIRRMVYQDAGRLALIGIGLGVPAAGLAARTVRSLLFATPATDLQTYVLVVAILVLAVAFAAAAPLRRAARVDPLVALRAE